MTYRKSFSMTEIALPAAALRNQAVAKWVRDQGLIVDVHTSGELATAITAGIHPVRMTLYADGLSHPDLLAVAMLGVGRIVVSAVDEIELLGSVVARRNQGVVVRMTDVNMPQISDSVQCGFPFGTIEGRKAIRAVVESEHLNLVGLHCQVGSHEHDFISYPAAIGHMIAEMTQIRRQHGVVITRLGLGGGRIVPSGDCRHELAELAVQIDESLEDACATMRFPRPLIVLSTSPAILEQQVA